EFRRVLFRSKHADLVKGDLWLRAHYIRARPSSSAIAVAAFYFLPWILNVRRTRSRTTGVRAYPPADAADRVTSVSPLRPCNAHNSLPRVLSPTQAAI